MTIYTQDSKGATASTVKLDAFCGMTPEGEALLDFNTPTANIRLACSHSDLLRFLSVVSVALAKTAS